MTNFEKSCEMLIPEKESTDILKMNYITREDINICNYVTTLIPRINFSSFNVGNEITLVELIDESLEKMKIFDNDIYVYINNLIYNTRINMCNDDIYQYSCYVGHCIDENGDIIDGTGIIKSYDVPKTIYEYSVYALCHEHIHALKETNYAEYRDVFRFGETLPIFFELILSEDSNVFRSELLYERLFGLYVNKYEFFMSDKLLKKHKIIVCDEGNLYNQRSIYEYVRSKCGAYLNSFYYAVILYNLYKDNPKKILKLVSRVLKEEKTTFELLCELNIYGDIRGQVFENELNKIKKMVK